MIKRVISLVLSLVMVLCMMPMNIVASAENMEEGVAANEEEKMLFAAWSDFSNYLYDFHDLPVNMMTSLVFLFGNEENYVVLNDGLSADGCVTIEDAGIENGCQTWNIWPTEMGPGAILYTEDGVTYTFDFTVIEPWEGGDSPEGPGNDVDDSVIRLFACWEDGSGYLESSEICYGSSSPLVFCFGTYEDHIFVDDLQTTGVATLQSMGELSFDGAPRYDLGVSDLGAGAVQYTHTDGTVYTYSVEGILGYSGDLIAVSTDESRGYKGLIYNTSLPVGDCFEAKFAILNSTTTYQLLPEDAQITASGSLSLEKIDGGLYRVTVNEDSEGQISYTDGNTIAAMYVWGYVGGGEGPGGDYSPEWCQDVIYQGQTVSVFIGDVWEEELQDIQGYGDSYGSNYYNDFRFRFLLGAFTGYETDREALAPAGFYDCISDIYFYLENTSNELGNSEKRNCWLSNEADGSWQDCREITPAPYVNPSLGIKSAYTYLRAEAGQGFQTTVCMRFTYDDPSDDIEAATYTVKIGGGYSSSGDIILDLSTGEYAALVDTAAELNTVMSSYEALCGWLQTHFPEQFSPVSWQDSAFTS